MPTDGLLGSTRRRRIAAVAALLIVAVGAGTIVWLNRPQPAPTYATAKAEIGTLRVTIPAVGNIATDGTWVVAPPVSGVVVDVAVRTGERVSEGEQLFTIDNPELDIAVSRAGAAYGQAREAAKQARLDRDQAAADLAEARRKHSAEPTRTPALAVRQARQKLSSARAAITAAEVEVLAADLAYHQAVDSAEARKVLAPGPGVVTALSVYEGQTVGGQGSSSTSADGSGGSGSASSGGGGSGSSSSGGSDGSGASTAGSYSSAGLTISGMGTLVVLVQLNEVDLPRIALRQPVSLAFDALPDLVETGTVTAVDTLGINTQGVVAYTAKVTLAHPDKRIRPGMTVSASIIVASSTDAVMVPNAAIRRHGRGSSYVWVVDSASATPRQVDVQVGLVNDTYTEIKKGLGGGETVITNTATVATASTSDKTSGGGLNFLNTEAAGEGGGPPPGRGGGGGGEGD